MLADKKKIFIFTSFFILGLLSFTWAIELPYIDKSKIRLSIAPGQTEYADIVVENPTPEPRHLRLYLEDWRYAAAGEGTKEFAPANTMPLSCASWINFSPADFTIPAFGRQKVNYAVKVPADATGGHYAALFFEGRLGEPEAVEEGVTAGINLAVRIASLFYVEAKGAVKRTAVLEDLKLKRDKTSGLLSVEANIRNTGNVDITASGSFHIMDSKGLIFARGEFNKAYTFPGDSAKLRATWKEPIPQGKYILVLTIDIGKALEEAGMGRGPITVKEAQIEIGSDGEVISVGSLK